ncbi:DUF4400 domain-containing protein [Aquabacterium humicola]|uniref:DUF4400 domain-containing protein n=1 Tax=Aquabacterium humicola TaxID=3237377 RepID=UPI0025439FEC|nr:DUF4400 domain-containing protein [Rubrivivax pictus]
MIRIVAIACLLGLLGMVLYLPAAYPAEHFLLQMKMEHSTLARLLGDSAASDVLSRSMSLHASSGVPSLPKAPGVPTDPNSVPGAVANEMASLNRRLFGNAYFRSVEALAALAAFRLSTILEWLPWLSAFGVAALVDGRIEAIVVAREFARHDPELFSVFVISAFMTIAVMACTIVLPHSLHPSFLPLALAGVLTLVARSLAHFRRGG